VFSESIELKTPAQIASMRAAGLVVARTLEALRPRVVPGVTTAELDQFCRERLAAEGATSNFLNYHGFPATICISVNDEIVHGIPGSRTISDGDLVSLDFGAIVDGWHGDSAITVEVGNTSAEVAELNRVTEEALWRGIAAAKIGGKVGDISHAVGSYVKSQAKLSGGRYGITEGFTGHGIGSALHQSPDVPNTGRRGKGAKIVAGMALAIEPMITLGTSRAAILEDEWTAVTTDGTWAAHHEHTITVTETGVWVLTALDGGAARLAELGVPCGAPT